VKIGILSDTHNHKRNTQTALAALRERGVDRLIHCGDITTPEIITLFAGWTVTFVFGNIDSDWTTLIDAAKMIGAARPRLSADVEADGKLVGVTHGADQGLLYRMVRSGRYAYLCHGHTHERRDEVREGGVRLINPGALGGSQPQTRSVCILDTAADTVEFIEFPGLK
jgi:putative phosphoesterase